GLLAHELARAHLRAPAVRDVLGDADETRDPAVLIQDRERAVSDAADLAIGPDDPVLDVVLAARLSRQRGDDARPVLRVDRVDPGGRVLVEPAPRPAPDRLVAGADVQHALLVDGRDPEHLADVLDQLAQQPFAVAQPQLAVELRVL